jgi:hypothetical protein
MTLLYQISRFLQAVGMILLPIAIAGNVAEKIDLKESLSLSSIGILIFVAGWLLQQMSKPK